MAHKYALLSITVFLAFIACSTGCAPLHCLPDHCADAAYQCELVRAVHNICSSNPCLEYGPQCDGCGIQVYDEVVVLDEVSCVDSCPRLGCVEPGPPPIPYEPPLPPKFLPVPTRSVFIPPSFEATTQMLPDEVMELGPQLADPSAY